MPPLFYAKKHESFFLGDAFNYFMMATIVISSGALVLNTEPRISQRYGLLLEAVEGVACLVFMAEYVARLYVAGRDRIGMTPMQGRLGYAVSLMGIVDLLSFLPSLFILAGVKTTPMLLSLQLLRLVKLTRYSVAFDLLADVLKDEAQSLIVSFVLMVIMLIFASVGIYAFEHEVQPRAFGSIPSAMWWAIVTLTTVGYGDVTPVTAEGKIFATLITVIGVGLVSLPAGIIASGFTEQLRMRRTQFQAEVEELIHDDGELSNEDMGVLERDRKELGINRGKAELIIKQVRQREQRRVHREGDSGR